MNLNRYWYVYAVSNILLLALGAMVNDGLASWSISIFLAGPCIIAPALRLTPGWLLLSLAVTGLAVDAWLPTPPGFLMSLLIGGALMVLFMRRWLGRVRRVGQVALAWLANGFCFAAFTLWAATSNHATGVNFIERAAVDLGLSQIVVIPISLWLFDLQDSALAFAGLTAPPPRDAEAG
jgi:hypothetical protein